MKPGDKVRATLSYILFDQKSFDIQGEEIITFAQLVRNVFNDWINKRNDWIIRFTYKELPQELNNETFVFWKICRKRCAAAILLYSVVPFYKFSNDNESEDKHGVLILELLDSLLDAKKEINRDHITKLNLQYYWHDEVPRYLSKTLELLDMTDEEFMGLAEFDTWLNT